MATCSADRAWNLMSRNMLGVQDAIEYYGVQPNPRLVRYFATIPCSEGVLELCADTHLLVSDFGLSISEIRRRVPSQLFRDQSWYDREPFATRSFAPRWHLIRKSPVRA